jgi:hypothetical protein
MSGYVFVQVQEGDDVNENVRFGSEADMCSAKGHVRFTPNSDRESGRGGRRRARTSAHELFCCIVLGLTQRRDAAIVISHPERT